MLNKDQSGHALKWSTCSYSNTEQLLQYSIVTRQRTSVSFKLVVRSGTGSDGLVGLLLCTTYLGNTAMIIILLFHCSLAKQVYSPSPLI